LWIQDIDVPTVLISYATRTIQKSLAKELAPYHIGRGHFAFLISLYKMENRSQDSLTLFRGFDKKMIVKSVVRLEEEGGVWREIDLDDKRVKQLYLTEKSRNIRPEMERIGYRLNELSLIDPDKSATAMRNLRQIALNSCEV